MPLESRLRRLERHFDPDEPLNREIAQLMEELTDLAGEEAVREVLAEVEQEHITHGGYN
jgi:hypothetical protein